jgi:LuxR family maltose regulon positive regulatory protein
MTTLLLKTKLYIPPLRPEFVSRPRLIERLNAGLGQNYRFACKLTLISAPAGFGKTTLLSEWIAGCERPVAWISLDEGDNDWGRFLASLVAALRMDRMSVVEGIEANLILGALQSPQPPSMEESLAALINQISALPDDLILVLDDYHLITSQLIHDALSFLLDHLPGNMHLVIASRSDPPLHLARLRGGGQLIELRQADLRFTLDEVADFLNRIMGLELSADEVATLASRTEGWAAGLQMASIAMQSRLSTPGRERSDDVATFIQAFTGSERYILDYLLEEVLYRQSERVQTFLLHTSILDRLTGPLCDAVRSAGVGVTGQGDGQMTLERLEKANLFIVPLDNERRWYRYHHLFADLLRKRLYQVQPDLVPALHGRASEWCEHHGLMAPAIDHALSATDFERAARLISEFAETLWGEGAQTILSTWLEALPDEQVVSRPQLCIFHAMVLFMTGQFDAAERRLQAAERVPDSMAGETKVAQQGMVAAARALMAYFRGDVPAIIRFSRQALEVLPEKDAMWRGSAAINLGDAYRWSGDMVAAGRAYAEAVKVGRAAGNSFLVLLARVKQAFIQMHHGRLQQAIEICRQQLQLMEEGGLSQTPMASGLFVVWGGILYERNELDEALHYGQKACELSERGNSVGMLGLSYLTLLRILFGRRDTDGVRETLHKLEKLMRQSDVPVWIASGVTARKVWMWVSQGRLAAATQWLQERGLNPLAPRGAQGEVVDDIPFPRQAEYLSLARLLAAQGRFEEARGVLERLFHRAEAGGQMGWMIGTLVLWALASQAQGDVAQAMASLERALSLAEPEGYVRIFVDEGPAMVELLRQAASRGIVPGYATRLLAAFDVSEYEGAGETLPYPPTQPLFDPLSERELEVLRFLATHLSSTDIARELFVAASTVRSHIKSIYSKLNVHSRKDAVRRAKELGLL